MAAPEQNTNQFWILTGIIVSLLLVYYFRSITVPLGIAFLLAYICDPAICWLEKILHTRKSVAALIVISVAILLIASTAMWLGPLLLRQVQSLLSNLPEYMEILSQRTRIDLKGIFQEISAITPEEARDWTSQVVSEPGKLWYGLKLIMSQATYILFSIVLIPVFWFLFSVHLESMAKHMFRYVPASLRPQVSQVMDQINHTFMGFFRGRAVIVLIMSAMFSLGWWWVGVPYWFLVGIVTGILNFIPYVSVVGWPAAILLKYIGAIQGDGVDIDLFSIVFLPSMVYGIVQFIEGWFLTPIIQGEQVDLHPGTVLVAVFLGGMVGGILGMLLSIPVAASFKIVCLELIQPRLANWASHH